MTWDITANQLTVGGVLLIAVLLVLLGQLIPRWVVTQIRKSAEDQIMTARKEADDWKAAYTAVAAARELQGRQLDDLLEYARVSDQFIRSLPPARRDQ